MLFQRLCGKRNTVHSFAYSVYTTFAYIVKSARGAFFKKVDR